MSVRVDDGSSDARYTRGTYIYTCYNRNTIMVITIMRNTTVNNSDSLYYIRRGTYIIIYIGDTQYAGKYLII